MRRRATPPRWDAGFVTAWTVALSVACWSLVGLALDGGRALRARSEAFGAAASAARAGAQAIDERALVLGTLQLDEGAARTAALEYVADRGFSGGSVVVDGLQVTVTISDRTDLYILPVASVGYTVSATARAVQGAPVT
jgi:Putative Flp pilus-assembly TadE/G-like